MVSIIGTVSYGLLLITIAGLSDRHISSLFFHVVCIAVAYEVANWFWPVWELTISTSFVYTYGVLAGLYLFGICSFIIIAHSINLVQFQNLKRLK